MLKSNEVFTAPVKNNRNFFAQKNRSRQERSSQALHDANRQAYKERKEQRRVLARTLDPIGFLQANGLVIEQKTRHFNVFEPGNLKREIARITYSADAGCWLSCGRKKERIGDNIALVRHLFGHSYLEAVDALLRSVGINDARSPALSAPAVLRAAAVVNYSIEAAKLPVMPEQSASDIEAGRSYLASRGTDLDIIKKAETNGNLRYGRVFRRQSVLFVGTDMFSDDQPMSITHRSVSNDFKGDIKDTNKAYPCILIGDTAYDIEVVEGGVSGLAAQTRAKREGRLIPTVIVTGGASVMRFLENGLVRELLTATDLERITVWFENETLSAKAIKRDAADTEEATVLALLDAKQAETDEAHEKQIAGIEALGGPVLVTRARPVVLRHKDVADVLIAEVTQPAAGSIAGFVEIQAAQNRDCTPGRA